MTFRSLVRLAVATLLVVIATAYVADATKMLPLYGRTLLDVELVCRNSTSGAPNIYGSSMISAFRYSLRYSASATSIYPFYVEHMQASSYSRIYYISSTEKYIVAEWDSCTQSKETNSADPEAQLATALVSMLNTALQSAHTTETVRGITAQKYTQQYNLVIPAAYGGLGLSTKYNAVILTTMPGWKVNLDTNVEETILSAELTSVVTSDDTINNCLFTFTFYGANVSDVLPTSKPSECTWTSKAKRARLPRVARASAVLSHHAEALADSSAAESSAAESTSTTTSTTTPEPTTKPTETPSTGTLYAMPNFPPQFTANFFVISPSQKSVYQVREAFSEYSMSHAQLEYPLAGAAGRVYDYEWFVTGYDQMTYYRERFAVPNGQETIDKKVREYFWPDKDTCMKVLIGYDIVAGNAETLLLASPNASATFIGNETVRNIPCGVWAAEVGGVRVTWYWATPGLSNVSFFQPDSTDNAETTFGTLVRMTVTGQGGSSPLFTHHPFFAQGYPFPASDRATACNLLQPTGVDMSCNGWDSHQTFNYIYDITSFVPSVRSDEYMLPTTCASAPLSGSIPSFMCNYSGVSGAVVAVLLVIIAVLFGLMGGSCVWCRYSRMVRRQQEELMRLTQELQNPSPPAGNAGGAAPVDGSNANGWSSGAPDMKPMS